VSPVCCARGAVVRLALPPDDTVACSCPYLCLQVFKVPGKGWGVRCSVDVPVGAVLCAYVGTVITDR
jgi:hypothetical protein